MLSSIFTAVVFFMPQPAPEASQKYLRAKGAEFELEWLIGTTTIFDQVVYMSGAKRGKTGLMMMWFHDDKGVLKSGFVRSEIEGQSAEFKVTNGKAKIQRVGKEAQEFDVPPGVIVTSAPDWTDAWMLCRRFDHKKKGKQEFAGLWIHPVEPAQRLTFAIEKKGQQLIEHAGKKQEVDRFTIWLRGNSSYAIWADAKGQMIKLVPLPYNEKAMNWLVLEGFEKSAADLKP